MPEIIANKYELPDGKTFVAKDKSFAETEIGDLKQPDFHPQVKIKRWDNEVNFSARLVHEEKTPQVITEDGKIKWLGQKVEVHFYDTGSLKEDEGGYEFEIVLKEPPKSNILAFTIQTKGLDFFYQPPLANINPDGSCWEPNDTDGIRTRPAKSSGSYAVYHQTMAGDFTALGGKNYKTGKAFHIYRPRIEDAAGAWCWGELNLDVKAGLLTVTIPQDFLDKAVYPVRHAAGLNFGYDHVGASEDSSGGGYYNLFKCYAGDSFPGTPANSGTLTGIAAYCKSSTNKLFNTAIYYKPSSDMNKIAGVDSGGTASGTNYGWVTTPISASIVAGTQYYLGIISSGATLYYKYDSGASGDSYWTPKVAGWPDPFGLGSPLSEKTSIYGIYTADSGVTGTLAGTLANVTAAIAGAHGVAGTAAGTLGNVTGSATGTVRVEGALAGTLGQITGAFSGAHGVAGSLAGTLTTATGVFSGAHGVAGTGAGQLSPMTADLAGTVGSVAVTGTLAGTLGNLTGSVAGAHGVAGETAGVLPNLTGSIDGKFWPPDVTGETVCILPNLIGDFRGKFWPPESEDIIGTLAGTLPNLTGNLVGTFAELSAKWKFPTLFSDSGFQYGDYDPGQAAAIAIGCLHIFMKTGDARAGAWARRILDDLRVNRRDQDYGGYMSDRRYGWLNALVLQTFGLGVNGVPGQSYRFPDTTEDKAHFDALISWIMARAGDEKPNVLNSDLIPFTFSEAGDMWSSAPYYLAMGPMGSLEAVVLMLGGALERGKIQGDWEWFNRLLAFMVRDNLVVLSPAQIRTVTAACDQAGAANLVRLRYADYDRDGSKYFEARDQAAIDNRGEQALDLDFRYGSPVILEDPGMARLLCTRLLQRLAPPLEAAEVETWLEGVRIELGDTVAVSSDFHGWDREEFTVLGKNLDLGRRRVHLKLSRTMDYADFWAVDAAGSAFDAWAIDLDSSWDGHWDSRTYVY